jgi:hypothetical protein
MGMPAAAAGGICAAAGQLAANASATTPKIAKNLQFNFKRPPSVSLFDSATFGFE